MKSLYNGKKLGSVIYHERATDFSKVTAHPEFVLKGKTFHDETGQLKTGTAAFSIAGGNSGGTDTSDATATEGDVVAGATFYANGEKKTGTMPSATANTPTLTIESAGGGSVDVKHLQMFNTYLPAGETKVGTVTDTNFIPSNIKKNVKIFGVTGEYEGEGGSGGNLPQLYAPTLTLNGDTLIITENASNGTFTKSYDLYIDGSFVGNYTSTTIDLETLELADGDYTITVRAKGTNFADSADSTISYTVGANAGLYQSGVLVKTWDELKTEYPKVFETAGELNGIDNGFGGKESALTGLSGELRIGTDITSIGKNAFQSCKNLTFVLHNNLTSIGENAFRECNGITSIVIPDSVTFLGGNAFYRCINATSVTIGRGVTELAAGAFFYTAETIFVPQNVKIIASGVFGGSKIRTLTFEGTPETIDANAISSFCTTINVPWAEGAVANAPWGAPSATINYNYVAGA